MALQSMTGFARREGRFQSVNFVCEARSVNGRNLDVKCRVPGGFDALDRQARDMGKALFQRGQIGLTLSLSAEGSTKSVRVNQAVLEDYLSIGERLIEEGRLKPARLDGLLSLKGVIENAEEDEGDTEALAAHLAEEIEAVFLELKRARLSEGAALRDILLAHLETLSASLSHAESLADTQTAVIRERFERRLAEVMGASTGIELEERITQEAAVLATKADVREEIDRLKAHLEQAHELIHAPASQGRKLDFLAQEFMREANTLCSKSALTELTRIGLDLKSTIDQLREQIQNVE